MMQATKQETMAVKEHPIPFSGEMVRAILEGRKTQTRRVVTNIDNMFSQPEARYFSAYDLAGAKEKFGDDALDEEGWHFYEGEYPEEGYLHISCPYGKPGDRLWVRETARLIETVDNLGWVSGMSANNMARFRYEADGQESGWLPYPSRLSLLNEGCCVPNGCYKEAHRINLEVVNVRVERLQEISGSDIEAEGVDLSMIAIGSDDYVENQFRRLWDSINAKRGYGWDANPWVWVVEFERV